MPSSELSVPHRGKAFSDGRALGLNVAPDLIIKFLAKAKQKVYY